MSVIAARFASTDVASSVTGMIDRRGQESEFRDGFDAVGDL